MDTTRHRDDIVPVPSKQNIILMTLLIDFVNEFLDSV